MINKIHYTVEIQTDYAGTIPAIGMNDTGVIRYATDGFVPNNVTYEDSSPVTGIWNTSLLTLDGISSSTQSLDLASGGDYAFQGNLDIKIINDSLQYIINGTAGLQLVGSTVNMYVVLDDVMYDRWTGVITGLSFDENYYTFTCNDKNNTENANLVDYVFGLNDTKLTSVLEDAELVVTDSFIKRINAGPFGNSDSEYKNWSPYIDTTVEVSTAEIGRHYCGLSQVGRYITPKEQFYYYVSINGHNANIQENMYLTFSSDEDKYHLITNVEFETFQGDDGLVKATKITIYDKCNDLQDYSELYGLQLNNATEDVKLQTEIASTSKLTVSIHKKGIHFKAPNNASFVINDQGKYEGLDSDGNRIFVECTDNGDGTVSIVNNKIVDIKKPSLVQYWSGNDGDESNDQTFTYKLLEGSANNLSEYGLGLTLPNDLNPDGLFTVSDYSVGSTFLSPGNKLYHYYYCTFDKDISDYSPFALISSLSDSLEIWNAERENGSVDYNKINTLYMGTDYTSDPIDQASEFYSPYINTAYLACNSMHAGWEITVYRVFTDIERGEVPVEASTYILPNMRNVESIEKNSVWNPWDLCIYKVKSKSLPSTNLPINQFNENADIISTANGLNSWSKDGGFDAGYEAVPMFSIPNIELPAGVERTNKVLFSIKAIQSLDGQDNRYSVKVAGSGIHVVVPGGQDGLFTEQTIKETLLGVNSLGLYKVTSIDSIEDISLKTVNSNIDTFSEVIKDLTGSESDLMNRDNWYVGGQIEEENSFSVITKLCKQGFVGGFTDRFGKVILKDFIEDQSTPRVIDNNLTVDGSITKFSMTDINKCYNEFSIKFHKIGNEYQKEISINNVDSDSFPEANDFNFLWSSIIDIEGTGTRLIWNGTGDTVTLEAPTDGEAHKLIQNGETYFRMVSQFTGDEVWIVANPVYVNTTATHTLYDMDLISGNEDSPGIGAFKSIQYNLSEEVLVWQEYVSGIIDYVSAKDMWTKAHESWLENKRIRVAPTVRTDLEYAKEYNLFYNISDKITEDNYGWAYTNLFLDWTTRQKYVASMTVPITTDTLTWNLLDKVAFSDPLLLGFDGIGFGWITRIQLDTRADVIKLTVMFEPSFLRVPRLAEECIDIIEDINNVDDIIEDINNVDDIIEGHC